MVAGANGGVEHWSADELLGELREFEAALADNPSTGDRAKIQELMAKL